MTDEVKFTDEQWDKVAEAAEVFARALESERRSLKNLLKKNWAGDCAEGVGTIDNLRMLLHGEGPSSFSGAVESEAAYLRSLAIQCRDAKSSLTVDDLRNANQFRSAK